MAAKTIKMPDTITVGELAEKLEIPVTKLISELMKMGIFATLNERVDTDTVEIIIHELNLDFIIEKEQEEKLDKTDKKLKKVSQNATLRPPIIAVMGHVDHGKTTLLDAIRTSKVAEKEAGGITQHLSAYQVIHNGRSVTFLDTPGHEAFSALRAHGAQLTDIAILVVAADDGVKPQTKEAAEFIKKAGVKIITAINKIDAPGANPNLVKQQLSEIGLMPEEWGGEVVTVEVSAKTKDGIDKLLDMVLLTADIEELKADINVPSDGVVIESHIEKGKGPVVTVLVQSGKLRQGDYVVAGETYGKIRTLTDYKNETIKEALPSTPAVITGFKTIPHFGEEFIQTENEKEARRISSKNTGVKHDATVSSMSSSDLLGLITKKRELKEFPVVVKADVQGSVKSVIDSLESLSNDEVAIRVIASGVGNIKESDIRIASASGAKIYGFNVIVPAPIRKTAERENVSAKVFNIIYELIDDAKKSLTDLLEPEVVETKVGRLKIKGVFRTSKDMIICGGEVIEGKITKGIRARIFRKKDILGEVEVDSVQKQTQEVKEVVEGEMCGLKLATQSKIILEENDELEFFTREIKQRKLESVK
ncbi:translation initiation factor IF-2 [Candidatus Saccharibacteria bacterium CPR2]|nr:translation initiation factor IF-2 [Candidatus Saccharibacteria bacterium CPR2]